MKKYLLTLTLTIVSLAALTSFVHAQEYTFSRDLSAGVSGDDVTALQTWLISSGFDIPAISSNSAMKGYFGSQTRQALMKYQLSIGLPNTGYFGPMTRGRIHDSYRGNSLVVTSPNGGEVWKKGTVQNITWNSMIKQGLTERFNYTANIMLVFPMPACAKPGENPMCMIAVRAPYTIVKGVSLSAGTYSWNVGSFVFDPTVVPYCSSVSTTGDCINPSPLVEDGKYTIQICPTNGSQCDESNGEFTITSGDVTSKAPVINGIDAPTALNINQTGTWTVRAIDPQNSSLSYSVDWGDTIAYAAAACPQGYSCQANPPSVQQTSTFTHSYSTAGTYRVIFSVRNSAGSSAQSSATVTVGSNNVGTLKITSPNGGEMWTKGTTQNITWTAPAYFRATYADIKLTEVKCAPGYVCTPSLPSVQYNLAKNISINQNLFSWKVGDFNPEVTVPVYPAPDYVVPNGQYQVQICEVGTNNCDVSDQSFTITSPTSPTVKVTSPNGGEMWPVNSIHQISWSVAGAVDVNTKVDMYLIRNVTCQSGSTCMPSPYVLDKNIAYNFTYNWIVGTDMSNNFISPGQFKVVVCLAGTTNCDTGDDWFTISQ